MYCICHPAIQSSLDTTIPILTGFSPLQGCPWSVPMTYPLSHAATPILDTKSNSLVISGPSAVTKQMSEPLQPESALASPDLLCHQCGGL